MFLPALNKEELLAQEFLLIDRLKKRGIGCHIIDLFVACLFYADDLCLIAPTRSSMQEMLTICQEYCSEFCLTFNVKKSKVLYFGKANTHVSDLMLDGKPLEFVKQWKYLGVTVTVRRDQVYVFPRDQH